MEIRKEKLSNSELLIGYMLEKCQNGIGTEVSADEFSNFVNEMLLKINAEPWNSPHLYIDEQGFEETCREVIDFTRHGYEINDNKLCATYDLTIFKHSGMGINNLSEVPHQVTYFMSDFSRKKRVESSARLSEFNLDSVPPEDLVLSKQISAYVVNNLMNRYVRNQLDIHKWPSHCHNIEKWILEKDLATTIELPGTRLAFLQLFDHSVRTVAEMLNSDQDLVISNNDKKCLAYNNFRKIVAPFTFLGGYEYSEHQLNNEEMTITVANGVANLSGVVCISNDPNGQWSSDYRHKEIVLPSDQSAAFEKKMVKLNQEKSKVE